MTNSISQQKCGRNSRENPLHEDVSSVFFRAFLLQSCKGFPHTVAVDIIPCIVRMVNSLVNDTCYNTVEAKLGKYGTSAFSLGFHNKQFWSFNGFLDNIWVIQTPQACKAFPQSRNILFVVKKPALTKRIKKLLDYWFYNHSSATKYYHKRNLLRVSNGR